MLPKGFPATLRKILRHFTVEASSPVQGGLLLQAAGPQHHSMHVWPELTKLYC